MPTEPTTNSVLLGLIATLIGALIFVLKGTMKRADDAGREAAKLNAEALAELKRAVDTFAGFKVETAALSAQVLADLRAVTATQERILEIQERILRELKEIRT